MDGPRLLRVEFLTAEAAEAFAIVHHGPPVHHNNGLRRAVALRGSVLYLKSWRVVRLINERAMRETISSRGSLAIVQHSEPAPGAHPLHHISGRYDEVIAYAQGRRGSGCANCVCLGRCSQKHKPVLVHSRSLADTSSPPRTAGWPPKRGCRHRPIKSRPTGSVYSLCTFLASCSP
jgi:hypothetical protein